MTSPLCGDTLIGVAAIALILLAAFPFWPIPVIAFECGLMVGVFLHSGHVRSTPLFGLTDSNE